jgi:sulfur carrier protein
MTRGGARNVQSMVDPPERATGAGTVGASAVGASAIEVVVNGQPRRVPDGQPLPDLVAGLGLRVGSVVVEYNGDALTAAESRVVRLRAGDRVELVRAVAGG